jgi:signal transduction histidine kinase/CheY-like chemotaxis protein
MEHTAGAQYQASEMARLKEENRKLQSELRVAKREFIQLERTIFSMENNFNVKMSMFRRLAQESEKQKQYLEHLLKNSVDFIVMLDNNYNVVYCSDLFLQKIGIKFIDKIEGKNILDVYRLFSDQQLFEDIKGGIEAAVKKGETTRIDVVADEGNGAERIYRIVHIPMYDEEGALCGVFIDWNDMTDVIAAKNEAEEANRSKSSFLAAMSHEIRTPLNAVIGITQIQLQKKNLPEDYAIALDKIYNSGNSLLGIINDILDMSKIETGKMEFYPTEYDTPSLINDAVQLNVLRIGSKPINFILDLSETLPSRLYGDELRIKQILNNLLSNAIKYTQKGYTKLSIAHTEQGEDVMLRIVVEDTGQGIKPEDCEKLFSEYMRFNIRANRATEGTGLGLSITKKLVTMMDGAIQVESEYGKGSIFTVTVKQKAVACGPIGPELAKRLRGHTYANDKKNEELQIVRDYMPYGKVLVVDDLETNLFVAEGLLSQYGLIIETTLNGFDTIDKVKSGQTYDIIFMDHMMPEMDGIETTQKLRALGYTGTIVALTANAIVGNDELFAQNGFDGFISKPIDLLRLNSVLNKFIRDKRFQEAEKWKSNVPDTSNVAVQSDEINPDLLETFRRDTENAIVTLRETAASGDIKTFTSTANAVKAWLAGIGENEKAELAFVLEKAGQYGDGEFIAANTEYLVEVLESLINSAVAPGTA